MSFAKLYAQTSSVPRNDAIRYLNKFSNLLKWKPYKENILDVGCGDGSVTKEILYPLLQNHLNKIYGVDVSAGMIEHAKANNSMDQIEYRIMDMGSEDGIDELENKFDHIFSFYCTHWIVDQRALVKRFHKILKPNGQIFITTLSDSTLHKTFKHFQNDEKWSKYYPKTTTAFTDYSENPAEYMRQLLEESGYDVDLSITERATNIFDDYKGFIRSIATCHHFINYIPKELQEEYVQDYIKMACGFGVLLESPNKYGWPYEALVFVATKKS